MKLTNKGASIAALVVFGAILPGCGGNSGTSYDLLSKAQKYAAHGNDNAAAIEVKNALQKDPKNGDARFFLAQIDNRRGNGAAAEIELEKAEALGLAKGKLDAALGEALLLQDKYQKLLDTVKPADTSDSRQLAGIYAARGDALIGLAKLAEAKAAFESAIKASPDSPEGYLGMARLAVSQKDVTAAIQRLDTALAKAPDSVAALTMKGDLLWAQKRDKDAEQAYAHIMRLEKNNIPVRLRLVSMALDEGNAAAAQSRLDELKKTAPNDLRIRYMQALLDFSRKDFSAARDALQDVVKGAADYMPAILLSGVIDYQLGLYEEARQGLSRFLFQFPHSAYTAKFLAATDLKLHHPEDAVKDLQNIVDADTKDPEMLALAAQAYMDAKDYSKATELFQRAASLDSNDSKLKTQLGLARLASGDTGRAIADLQAAVDLDPKEFKTDAIIVSASLRAKDYDKALTAARAWQKKQPDNPVVYNLEGLALLQKNDLKGARDRFQRALKVRGDYVPAAVNLAGMDLRDNDRDGAKHWFQAVLKADPNNLKAEMALAGLAQGAGDSQGEEQWLEQAIKQHPKVIQPSQILAAHYLDIRQPKKALAVARAVQVPGQPDPDALDLLGKVQFATGDMPGAVETYSKLVNVVPRSPLAYLRLAQAQQAAKQVKDAEASLEQAVSLNPGYTEAKVALASLEAMNGRQGDALRTARDIQRSDPKSPAGFDLEGNILMQQKKYLEAAKAYEQADDRADSDITTRHVYVAYRKAGLPAKAVGALQARIAKHPGDLTIRLALAQDYSARQDPKGAAAQYQAVLHRDPNNAVALNNLAWIYLQDHNPQATDLAERAYKASPDNPAAADTLGWALVQQGQPGRAVDVLKKAASQSRGDPSVTYHYAVALAKAGQTAQARKQLKGLLADGRSFPERADAEALLKGI